MGIVLQKDVFVSESQRDFAFKDNNTNHILTNKYFKFIEIACKGNKTKSKKMNSYSRIS